MTKRDYIVSGLVYAVLVALFIAIFNGAIASPDTMTYVSRFTTIPVLFVGGFTTLTTLFVVAVYVRFHIRAAWYHYLFYGVMLFSIAGMLIVGFLTNGESIRSIMFFDRNDTLMDFFNSTQYGMHPYEELVIYPPLINVFYGIIGKVMGSIGTDPFTVRTSQVGMLVFGTYAIFFYTLLVYLFVKCMEASRIEKVVFCFVILFSLPFIFLWDRGNAVLLTLIALLGFVLFYESESNKKRIVAYICLGIAAGIKITPAIFGLLVLSRKNRKEVALAFFIGCLLFFVPFVLTDGSPATMINNIRNTSNMQIFLPHENELHILGSGTFVDAFSLMFCISRIVNLNLAYPSQFVVLAFMLASFVLCFCNKGIAQWKRIAILTCVLSVPLGFAGIYNLAYFVIPLIYFLNTRPPFSKLNCWYVLLFLGIFVVGINPRIGLFNIFSNDIYQMRIMTFIEELSVSLLFITLVLDGAVPFYREFLAPRIPRARYGVMAVTSTVILCAGGWWMFAIHPVETFYPANMKAYAATRGFAMQDGLYYAIGGASADVYLKSGKALYTGMTVNFAPQEERSGTENVSVYVNDQLAATHTVDNYQRRDFLYIPATWLRDNVDSDQLHVRIEREQGDGVLPIDYIGYAQPTDGVPQSFYEYSSAGMVFYRNGGGYWTTQRTDFLLDEERFTDGVLFSYDVPLEFMAANAGRDIVATLAVNGKTVKQFPITQAGQGDVYLNASDIPSDVLAEIEENHAGILSIDCNADASERAQGSGADDRRRSLSIQFLGKCPSMSEAKDRKLYGETKLFVNTEDLDGKGLAMVYSVPSLLFADGSGDRTMEVSIDGTPVLQRTMADKHVRSYYDAFVLPAEAFAGKQGIVELTIRQQGMHTNGNRDEADASLPQIRYLGPAAPSSHLSKDDGDAEKKRKKAEEELRHKMWNEHLSAGSTTDEYMDAIDNIQQNVLVNEYQYGLTFDKGQQLFYGTNCDFFFWNALAATNGDFVMDYHIEPYLLTAAHGAPVTLALYLNDVLIRRIPVTGDGDFTCVIPRGELAAAAAKENGWMHFRIVPDTKYNLYDMNIARARELRADRSVGIRFFGFGAQEEQEAER